MTTPNQDVNVKVDVGIIKNTLATQGKAIERIEKKIDDMKYAPLSQVDKLREDFLAFQKEVETDYVSNKSLRPWQWFFGAVGVAVLTTIATAITNWVLKGGLR